MRLMRQTMTLDALALILLGCRAETDRNAGSPVQTEQKVTAAQALPQVTAPPESFFQMIEERVKSPRRGPRGAQQAEPQQGPTPEQIAAEMAIYRNFYKKYTDVKGLPVAAHGNVADRALQRTYEIVN